MLLVSVIKDFPTAIFIAVNLKFPKNNKMSTPIGQHYLPRIYLKHFAIDTNDKNLRSFIHCFSVNPYKSQSKKVSINSDRFKIQDFYTVKSEDPYVLEKVFGKEIEPYYDQIMTEINAEKNLTLDCRGEFVLWLYYNKFRNPAERSNLDRIAQFLIKGDMFFNHGKRCDEDMAKAFGEYQAKKAQIDSFMDEGLVKHFCTGMAVKNWIILRSRPDNPFLTNDNPGFSINMMNSSTPDFNTLNSHYAVNPKAWNYFPLSPKYCVLISPQWGGTPLGENFHTQTIEYVTTNHHHIDFINYCTTITRSKYLLSHNESLIKHFGKAAEKIYSMKSA